jgi:hypothetical protein
MKEKHMTDMKPNTEAGSDIDANVESEATTAEPSPDSLESPSTSVDRHINSAVFIA